MNSAIHGFRSAIFHVSILLFFWAVSAAVPCHSLADEAVVDEVVVTNSNTNLLLYLSVANAFTPELETGIQNGIPATFTFFVELYRNRKIWMDKEIASLTLDHTLTYDSLKEEYRVELSEKKGKVVVTKFLEEAKEAMRQVNGFTVIPLDYLDPDEEYLLKVKARLEEKTLPLYFHYLIPFWRLWDFETDWYTVEFRY